MEKFSDVRVFAGYRVNTDSSDEVMQPNEVRDCMNMVEEVSSGKIVNIKGFESVMSMSINNGFSLPDGTFKLIGSCYDVGNDAIMLALCDTIGNNHSILRMISSTKQLQWVSRSEPKWNFQSTHPVWMIVISGILYLTDGYEDTPFVDYNPPRKLNIDKAIAYTNSKLSGLAIEFTIISEAQEATESVSLIGKTAFYLSSENIFTIGDNVIVFTNDGLIPGMRYKEYCGYVEVLGYNNGWLILDIEWLGGEPEYKTGQIMNYVSGQYFGIDWQVIDLIKHPPVYAPTCVYGSDDNISVNKLKNRLFQFIYRYKYDDNEYSVWSPISDVPLPTIPESIVGADFEINLHVDNIITITLDSGPAEVKEIEIAARQENKGSWGIIHREYKYSYSGEILLGPDQSFTYNFSNNEAREILDQIDTSRPFDHVPQIAGKIASIESNRIALFDYTEGLDIIDINMQFIPKTFPVNLQQHQTYYVFEPLNQISPSYAKGISWNLDGKYYANPPPDGKYISPCRYSCVVCDFENIPIIQDAQYFFQISASFYTYNTPSSGVMPWPEENQYDSVVAQAIVTCSDGDTIQSMLNKICVGLRSYATLNQSAIAFVKSKFDFYNNHLWSEWTEQGDIPPNPEHNLTKDSELGIVLQVGGAAGVNFDEITIQLEIISSPRKYPTFKSGTNHKFGIAYVDRAGRYGAVNTDVNCNVYLPFQSEYIHPHLLYRNYLYWEIRHQPPIDAAYFQFFYTKNTSFSYFVWCPAVNLTIEEYLGGYSGNFISIGVLSNFVITKEQYGKFNVPNYEWQSGDRVRFLFYGIHDKANLYFVSFETELDFEILQYKDPKDTGGGATYLKNDLGEYQLDTGGNKIKDPNYKRIIIKYFDYKKYNIDPDNLIRQPIILEIYRQAKTSENVVFYSFGPKLQILNPHTPLRSHSGSHGTTAEDLAWQRNQVIKEKMAGTTDTTAPGNVSARGIFWNGDAYIFNRYMENNLFSCLFPCESESYSDWFDSEAINIGLPNLENRNARRIRYFANGRHGGRLIQNTQINNVSTFLYDDIMQLQEKHGIIHYADEKGQHLKVIQDRKVTRVPIGRVTLEQAAAGKGVVAATKEVLGVPDPFESDFGTVHPGSVIKYETRIYFFDFYAKAICRDAGNGVQDISFDYNFKTLIQNACSLFGTAENVDVISSYDNEHQMVLWTFIDKTTTSNSFTIGFRDSGGRNKDGYIGKFRFIPDYYGLAKNTLVSWKNNLLWLHNSSNTERCTFYNVNYSYWVTPIFNKLWQTVKRYLTLILSTDKVLSAPNAGDISIAATSNNPNGMVSLLKSGAFSSVQGNFIAEIGKNMITHQSTAEVLDLIDGDDMQGQSMTVRLEGNENTEHKLLSVEAQGVTSNV